MLTDMTNKKSFLIKARKPHCHLFVCFLPHLISSVSHNQPHTFLYLPQQTHKKIANEARKSFKALKCGVNFVFKGDDDGCSWSSQKPLPPFTHMVNLFKYLIRFFLSFIFFCLMQIFLAIVRFDYVGSHACIYVNFRVNTIFILSREA